MNLRDLTLGDTRGLGAATVQSSTSALTHLVNTSFYTANDLSDQEPFIIREPGVTVEVLGPADANGVISVWIPDGSPVWKAVPVDEDDPKAGQSLQLATAWPGILYTRGANLAAPKGGSAWWLLLLAAGAYAAAQ